MFERKHLMLVCPVSESSVFTFKSNSYNSSAGDSAFIQQFLWRAGALLANGFNIRITS
jgi:hypothetical protein